MKIYHEMLLYITMAIIFGLIYGFWVFLFMIWMGCVFIGSSIDNDIKRSDKWYQEFLLEQINNKLDRRN